MFFNYKMEHKTPVSIDITNFIALIIIVKYTTKLRT